MSNSESDLIAKIDALERDAIDDTVDWQMSDSPAYHTEYGDGGAEGLVASWLGGGPVGPARRTAPWRVVAHRPNDPVTNAPVPPAVDWIIDHAALVLYHHSANVAMSTYRLELRFLQHPMRIDVTFTINDEAVIALLPDGSAVLYSIANVGYTGWNVRLERIERDDGGPPIKAVLYGHNRPETHVPARDVAPTNDAAVTNDAVVDHSPRLGDVNRLALAASHENYMALLLQPPPADA